MTKDPVHYFDRDDTPRVVDRVVAFEAAIHESILTVYKRDPYIMSLDKMAVLGLVAETEARWYAMN